MVILDTKTKSVESVQCSIRPVFLSWHPLSHFFIVTSREGEAVLFDVGLSQLDFVPIRMVLLIAHITVHRGVPGVFSNRTIKIS